MNLEAFTWVPTQETRWFTPDNRWVIPKLQRQFQVTDDSGFTGFIWAYVLEADTYTRIP